jgi:mono/diheme cytochrome c family protein
MEFVRKNIVWILSAACILMLAVSKIKRDHNDPGTEYSPNMYHPVGYEPLSQINPNSINPMGMNMRVPANGTVKRRMTRDSIEASVAAMDLLARKINPDAMEESEALLSNPLPATEKYLAEGKVAYERYCQHCHGEGGKGDGPVNSQYKGVPNYASDALKDLNDGHIYHTITHGKGRMWPHGSQISAVDRWKIVLYVHKLQQG